MSDGYDEPGCIALRSTERALLVRLPSGEETWVPHGQIHDDSEVCQAGDRGTLIVSTWLAERRGWL